MSLHVTLSSRGRQSGGQWWTGAGRFRLARRLALIAACGLLGCLCAAAGAALAAPAIGAATTSRFAAAATPRIVGGGSVSIARFPFQVALYDPQAGSISGGFFCGGVIIDATHVATAAHCVIDSETGHVVAPSHIAVLAGASRLSVAAGTSSAGGSGVKDPAAATAFDPSYSRASSDYDVGVVTLKRPLWSSPVAPAHDGFSAIAPIAVDPALAATYANPNAGVAPITATVSGWGDTHAEPSGGLGSYPDNLQSVRVPLVSAELCASDYADPFASQPITARMLCAGGQAGGGDSCFGDSGGPLVVDSQTPANPPSDYVLAGLVSFGDGCAQAESPGVYARIADTQVANFLTSEPGQSPLTHGGGAATTSTSPELRVVGKGCTHARCTVSVTSAAHGGSRAVRTVHATLGLRQRATCRRRGKRVACIRLVSRTPRVRAVAGGRFVIVADHLGPGRCTFKLTAIDRAGHKQTTPTTVALIVK
jgi:secreted trypsin-like serine protease